MTNGLKNGVRVIRGMVCNHYNAKESKLGLICVDCGKKLNGVLKPKKEGYKPFNNLKEECYCTCHKHGHIFCPNCRNIHRLGADKSRVWDKVMSVKKAYSGFNPSKNQQKTPYANSPFTYYKRRGENPPKRLRKSSPYLNKGNSYK